MNDDGLAIALHHGSLDVAQRRKVEDAMAAGKLRGVVCTSSLDLRRRLGRCRSRHQYRAPKGASRLMQRSAAPITASTRPRARCWCRQSLRGAGMRGGDRRGGRECAGYPPLRIGALDVLAQHVLGCACASRFCPIRFTRSPDRRTLFGPEPNRFRRRGRFRGYGWVCAENLRAVRAHQAGQDRPLRVTNPRVRQKLSPQCRHHRRGSDAEGAAGALARCKGNAGSTGALGRGGRMLGEIEDISSRAGGRRYLCVCGEVVRYEQLSEDVSMSRAPMTPTPRCRPIWRQVSALDLSRRAVRNCSPTARLERLAGSGARLAVAAGALSRVPGVRELVVETFPRADKHYLSVIPLRGGWHIRRSDAFDAALERARARRSALSPMNIRWRCGDLATCRR